MSEGGLNLQEFGIFQRLAYKKYHSVANEMVKAHASMIDSALDEILFPALCSPG